MQAISFTPHFSKVTLIGHNIQKKEQNTQNTQRTNITELPSFGALKPITEDKKCRKLLLDAKTERGTMRFPTNDEIHLMEKAIKGFKTNLSKSALLADMLSFVEFGKRENSQMNAQNIADYFNLMSGKSAGVQTMVAKDISRDASQNIARRIELFKSGLVTSSDLEYLNKHLSSSSAHDTKQSKFYSIMRMAEEFPGIMKYKNVLVEKANIGIDATDIMCEMADKLTLSAPNATKLLSMYDGKNYKEYLHFIENIAVTSPKIANNFVKLLNKDNIEYVQAALRHENIRNVLANLNKIKVEHIELPQLADFRNDEKFYEYVNRMINPSDYD